MRTSQLQIFLQYIILAAYIPLMWTCFTVSQHLYVIFKTKSFNMYFRLSELHKSLEMLKNQIGEKLSEVETAKRDLSEMEQKE